jgi:hypothetical protein
MIICDAAAEILVFFNLKTTVVLLFHCFKLVLKNAYVMFYVLLTLIRSFKLYS